MIIISIIMVWYSVSFYALLYENSDFTWKQMEKILRNGYWMLFGDLYLDGEHCYKIKLSYLDVYVFK